MQRLTITFIIVLAGSVCFGQNSQFKKGQIDINAGIGFITPLFAISGYDVKTKTPPISVTADYGITEELSVGLYVATAKDNVYGTLYDLNTGNSFYGKQSTVSHFLIGGRLLYHFELNPKFDTYGGGMLGYNSVKEKAEPNIQLIGETDTKGFTYTLLVGGRYRFAEHIGGFLELGYGVTVINLGLNIKL
ncbi:MAG: outer membrane beta-barrel protein [Sphingobacteriales bacterium]|nr:outer membrane beta-barrel protein [Sphingobacteriales bacterium]